MEETKMNKKMSLLLTPIILLLCMGLVSATITLTDTGSDTTFIGSGDQIKFTMNQTGTEFYGAGSVVVCNASLTSSLTTNTTAQWSTSKNVTAGVNVNMTWVINISSAQYEDANDYTIKINCSNDTASIYQGTLSTANTVDNTDPTVATITGPEDQATNRVNNTMYFSATVTDANTVYAYVYWRDSSPTGHSKEAMNCSGSLGTTCTYTASNVPDGTYYWTIETSDGTDSTLASYRSFLLNFQKMTGAAKTILYQQAQDSQTTSIPPIVIIIGIGVVVYLLATKGGKAKKKN
jgi:hypothetical protein